MISITPVGRRMIDVEKLLLMLGVVLIHSAFFSDFSNISRTGIDIMQWGSHWLTGCCVPIFFILSGFLFFNNVETFTAATYLSKLRSRVHTLLVPYILWNLIAATLFILKAKYLGYNGYDIVVNGKIQAWPFIRGFWNMTDGYPYEFSFWFILRLMGFVILSPVAWFMASRKWLLAIFFAAMVNFDHGLNGLEYFALGAAFARADMSPAIPSGRIMLPVFLFSTFVLFFIPENTLPFEIWIIVRNLLGAVAFLVIARFITRNRLLDNPAGHSLVSAAFIIYAMHSLYATIVRKTIGHVFGVESLAGCVATYLATWVVLVCASWFVYIVMHRLCPKVLSVLTGGRA